MRADSIQCSNVGKTQLTKRRLKNRDACLFGNIGGGGAVNGLDDLIHVRGNK
jgi:hypothetical protein